MRYLLIGWLVFFNVACSVTGKQPALHDFGSTAPPPAQQGKASVNVNAPTWLWDSRIRYRLLFSSPSEVRFYGLDRWIASPPELFEQLLNVSTKARNCVLIIRLQDFEQQFEAADRARVMLRFFAEVYSVDNKQKIGEQAFYLQQPAKTPDAAGAVEGFIDLARQAVKKIDIFVAGLPGRQD